ncbi:MAG: hypothetical protein ACAI44_05740 [Candidatus Sericytochromatia bacterium]
MAIQSNSPLRPSGNTPPVGPMSPPVSVGPVQAPVQSPSSRTAQSGPGAGVSTPEIEGDVRQAIALGSQNLEHPEVMVRYDQIQSALPQLGGTSGPGGSQPAAGQIEGGEGLGTAAPPGSVAGRFYNPDQNLTVRTNANEHVDLSSRDSRVRFANSFTQLNGEGRDSTQYGCGAACIVTGAMIQGGNQGIQSLCDVIRQRRNESFQQNVTGSCWREIPGYDQLDGIRERARNNTLTRGDMSTLQDIVYHQLRHLESPERSGGDGTAMLQRDAVREYINTDTATFTTERPLQNLFHNNVDIHLIDTDSSPTSTEHYVMAFGTRNDNSVNRVYDPWPRNDGQQVVDREHGMGGYLAASRYQTDGCRTWVPPLQP